MGRFLLVLEPSGSGGSGDQREGAREAVHSEVILKNAGAPAAVFLDTFRCAQPLACESHDESPTQAEDVLGAATANPALVFVERIVGPVVQR